MPEPTLAERHARIGRALDEMLAKCDAVTSWWPGFDRESLRDEGYVDSVIDFAVSSRVWLPALLAFARGEWVVLGGYISDTPTVPRGDLEIWVQGIEEPLSRLEAALAPLLGGKA